METPNQTKNSCRLSAAVLVFNGMNTLAACLDSLQFCDEIVVVDDMSTDGTWEYLQGRPDVQAMQQAHTTFARQRALARDRCHGQWLLTMDADEMVTPTLAQAILQAIDRPDFDGFRIRRKNPYPLGLNGHHWSWHPRLIRTDRCRWVDTDSPHAPLDTAGLRMGRIRKAWLDHTPPGDVATSLRKSINRGAIMARQLRARGAKAGACRLTLSSISRFFKMYVRYGGCLHGRDGFVFSALYSMDAFCKYVLLASHPTGERADATDGGPGSYPTAASIVDPNLPDPGDPD